MHNVLGKPLPPLLYNRHDHNKPIPILKIVFTRGKMINVYNINYLNRYTCFTQLNKCLMLAKLYHIPHHYFWFRYLLMVNMSN